MQSKSIEKKLKRSLENYLYTKTIKKYNNITNLNSTKSNKKNALLK